MTREQYEIYGYGNYLPAEPTYAMLRALAGEPVILAASDEQELRRRYFGECLRAGDCGCDNGVPPTRKTGA